MVRSTLTRLGPELGGASMYSTLLRLSVMSFKPCALLAQRNAAHITRCSAYLSSISNYIASEVLCKVLEVSSPHVECARHLLSMCHASKQAAVPNKSTLAYLGHRLKDKSPKCVAKCLRRKRVGKGSYSSRTQIEGMLVGSHFWRVVCSMGTCDYVALMLRPGLTCQCFDVSTRFFFLRNSQVFTEIGSRRSFSE